MGALLWVFLKRKTREGNILLVNRILFALGI